MIDEAVARRLLAGERAAVLKKAVDSGWDGYVRSGVPRHPTARAALVWDDTRRALDDTFVTLPGVSRRVSRNGVMHVYMVDGILALRAKKHDLHQRTRNYPTEQQQLITNSGMLDGEFERIDALTFGYELDAAEAGIAGYPVVSTIAGRVIWAFDLRENAGGEGNADLRPLNPVLPVGMPPLPVVASRRLDLPGE